jgi:hypothetical protein
MPEHITIAQADDNSADERRRARLENAEFDIEAWRQQHEAWLAEEAMRKAKRKSKLGNVNKG